MNIFSIFKRKKQTAQINDKELIEGLNRVSECARQSAKTITKALEKEKFKPEEKIGSIAQAILNDLDKIENWVIHPHPRYEKKYYFDNFKRHYTLVISYCFCSDKITPSFEGITTGSVDLQNYNEFNDTERDALENKCYKFQQRWNRRRELKDEEMRLNKLAEIFPECF